MVSRREGRVVLVGVLMWLVLSPFALWTLGPAMPPLTPQRHFVAAAPTISSPDDLTFENGTMGKKIVWNATYPEPKNYTITRNASIYRSGSWAGGLVEVDLNHLYTQNLTHTLPVKFVFVCTVFDMQNESVSDEVLVAVIPDVVAPILSSTGSFSYEEGSFGHSVNWTIQETNPSFFNITRYSNETTSNRTLIRSGRWFAANITVGRNITISVDKLNATHWYSFTLFVNDTFGRNSTSTVNVTVYSDFSPPTITSPNDISYEFGSKGHKIVWGIYDSNPKNYTIRVRILYNDTSYGNKSAVHGAANVTLSNWTLTNARGDNVSIDVTSIYLGNYTYTMTLYDKFGRNASDTVNLTIYKDLRSPVVTPLGNLTYEEGYTGHRLNWSADESNPKLYNLTRDGIVLMNGTWRGENISINVDKLAVGIHVFNMTMTDFFNQSTVVITGVNVTPDAHVPTIADVREIQVFATSTSNNLTIQAYIWDINNISSIRVEWGIDRNSSVNATMSDEGSGFYTASLGEYSYGMLVWYRLVAVDNSSVKNVHTTGWTQFEVTRLSREPTPFVVWGSLLLLGVLSMLVILTIYWRTKTK